MTDTEVSIRSAKHEDLNRIISMSEGLQAESRQFEPGLTFNADEAMSYYASELKNDAAHIIVAERSGSIVGYQYSYIEVLDYLADKNRECHLEAIYVEPQLRGLGIAARLLEEAERWAVEEQHADRFKAGIYASNTASEKLHEKYGFKPYYVEYIKEA
ncbi:MAG TPA: GNAT family N-acetyltransferase [Candidatus Saccharimonadales bacterium]|nr:GNAT family N-acetyltransferase [Candidatus Saccharimonadales bacterium]